MLLLNLFLRMICLIQPYSKRSFQSSNLLHSFSSSCSTSASGCMHAFVTPNKQHISQTGSPSLALSVNSRFHKIRKTSVVKMEPLGSPDPKTPTEIMKFSVPQSCILEVPDTLSTSFGDVMKKDLKISCSLCRHSLGLEENNYIVPCSLMSLSKVHLVSIWKGDLEKPVMGPTSVVVMVSDITSVDTRIWERSPEQGIWSKEDGCVFNKILCTFCSNQENCLGLHVVATGSSNVQFLNKALFYCDRLEIQHIDVSRNKEVSPSSVTSGTKSLVQIPSVRPETNSGGWRSTKSKMQLPKKSPNFICKTLMPNQSVNFKLVFMTIMIDFEDSISNGKMTVTMTMTKRMSLGSMFIFNSGDVCFELKDLSKRSSNVVYSQLYFIIVILH